MTTLRLEDTSLGFAVKKGSVARASKELADASENALNDSTLEARVQFAVTELVGMFPETARKALQEYRA